MAYFSNGSEGGTMKTKKMLGIGMTQRNVPKVMDGRKTQTRRIESCLRELSGVPSVRSKSEVGDRGELFFSIQEGLTFHRVTPRHQVGDRIYVKEALQKWKGSNKSSCAIYKVDNISVPPVQDGGLGRPWQSDNGKPWKPNVIVARYMPRSAARTFIEITDVRCERIQDISVEDIRAEGVRLNSLGVAYLATMPRDKTISAYRNYFKKLWNDTNGKGAWERNDWVFAYTFKLIEVEQ